MKTFSLTDLAHRSGEVAQAAHRAPVDITNRGKRTFVLIAADQFDALISKASARRAVHAGDLTAQEAEAYQQALEAAAGVLDEG